MLWHISNKFFVIIHRVPIQFTYNPSKVIGTIL